MAAQAQIPKDRFELRLNSAEKQRIQSAAQLRGQPISAFAREVMLREADVVVAEHNRISLSAEESRLFMAALSAPFEPNAKLAKAIARASA
jgi:uncharacterized protein (DUF1778 family)